MAKISKRLPYNYLAVLVMLFTMTYLTTGIVQYRLIAFGHIYFSFAIFVYPLSYLICDVVTEVYGYRQARQLIWCGIAAWILAGLFVTIATHLTPPAFWQSYAKQYDYIMGTYLRYGLSSALGVVLGQFLNAYIISKLKILVQGRYFWLRSVTSTITGDAITITVALIIIYYNDMSLARIFEIIFYEIIVNIIYTAIMAFPAIYIVKALKKAENMDAYDYDVKFNPFQFKLTDDENHG